MSKNNVAQIKMGRVRGGELVEGNLFFYNQDQATQHQCNCDKIIEGHRG